MSFHTAIKQFQDNVNLIDRNREPVLWNLSAGLLNLAEALEQHERNVDQKLEQIRRIVQDAR